MARRKPIKVPKQSQIPYPITVPVPKPKAGMVISVYLDRPDVGSGVRQYVITRVGRRYVTLFYIPQLKSVKIKNKDWATFRHVREDHPDMAKLAAGIEEQVGKYIRHGFQYSTVEVERVLKLILANTVETA